jgi:hypothetical protein
MAASLAVGVATPAAAAPTPLKYTRNARLIFDGKLIP